MGAVHDGAFQAWCVVDMIELTAGRQRDTGIVKRELDVLVRPQHRERRHGQDDTRIIFPRYEGYAEVSRSKS